MSAVLPDRVPLDLPDEDPAALAEAIAAVSGAAFRLGVLEVHLAGPGAAAPGWLGRDAAAAVAQVGTVVRLVREVHGALTTALHRLEGHAGLLDHTRARIAVLRARQQDDYDAAAVRLAALLPGPAPIDGPTPAMALNDDLAAAEAGRGGEHAALLAELRSDAVETAHALSAATAVVGGTGRRGQEGRVIAHLAAALPGWGDGELAARGADLARRLLGPGTPDEFAAWARDAEAYAGDPAFADALLGALGPEAFGWLLDEIVITGLGADDALPRLLARTLGAARPGSLAGDPVVAVLDATYVDRDDATTVADQRALGLAVVLAAGAAFGGAGVPLATVATWGGQVLRREEHLRATAGGTGGAAGRAGLPGVPRDEPVTWVLRLLAAGDEPAPCAALLADRAAWAALLSRPAATYADDGYDLRQVVALAGAQTGSQGDRAVRTGLEVLGAGLSDPEHWPVDRGTAAAVAFSLAEGVAAHVTVATDVLLPAAQHGSVAPLQAAALRGLGVVSLDPGGAAVIQQAVGNWARARTAAAPADALPAAAVVGGFVAVRHYGQRLAYALHGFEQRDDALARHEFFHWTAELLEFVPGGVGDGVSLVMPFVAHGLGTDGTWDNGRDAGLVFGPEDSAAASLVQLGDPTGSTSDALARHARASFVLATCVLGSPSPPESPGWDAGQALFDGVPLPDKGGVWDGVTAVLRRVGRVAR